MEFTIAELRELSLSVSNSVKAAKFNSDRFKILLRIEDKLDKELITRIKDVGKR